MKRAIVTILVTVLLGTISPGLPALALPLKTSHENPATARQTRIAYDLLTAYSDVINLAALSRYGDARDRLQELRQANIPADIAYPIGQYSDLYQRLFTRLDDLEAQLKEISSLLDRNLTTKTSERLQAAQAAATEAASLVKDTEAATSGLDEKLGDLSGLLPDDPLARAYDSLQRNIGRLAEITNRLERLNYDLSERYTELAGLSPTELSLEIAPATAFVGDAVTASGRLVNVGHPLPGRKVAIVSGKTTLATAATAADGSYEVPVTIPCIYADSVNFTAVYEPSDGDATVLLGAQSQPVVVATGYYTSQLAASAPVTIYPGTAFTLSGEVTPGDGPAGREIVVTLDGTVLIDAEVTGQFSLKITPPRDTPAGRQELKITVPPQGRYTSVAETRWTTVVIMNRQVQVETPLIFLQHGAIHVRGTVSNGPEPAGGGPVNLGLGRWRTATVTAPDGTFQADVPLYAVPPAAPLSGNPFYVNSGYGTLPFNLSPIGWQDLVIEAGDPGSTSGVFEMKKRIVSLNPLTAVLMAAFLAAAWTLAYRRQQKTGPVAMETPGAEKPVVPAPATQLLAPLPALTGIRGKVMAAYRTGLTAVERITGLVMGPDTTLREFLKKAPLPSPAARDHFTELTGIAESTLYSRDDPRRATATRAEALAHSIKEDLDRGAA